VADCKHGFQSRFGRAFTNAFLSYREVFPPARWRSCPSYCCSSRRSPCSRAGRISQHRAEQRLAGRPAPAARARRRSSRNGWFAV